MAKTDTRPRVAIDSNFVIAHVTGDRPEHAAGIASVLHEVDAQKIRLYGSTILITEVLGGCFDDPPDLAKENAIRAILENPSVITLAQVSRQVAQVARDLRPQYRLKVADSLHLATAVTLGVDAFMTMDDAFPIGQTVKGVRVTYPESALGANILPPAP